MKLNKEYFQGEVFDFLKDLVIIVVIVLTIRTFLIMPFQINGQSMDTSYYDREFIIVDRLSYIIGKPDRGDVVVFRPGVHEDKEYFLKRIIAKEGDKIKLEAGEVYLDKEGTGNYIMLDETYLNESNKGATYIRSNSESSEFTVPKGQYFVMGDNRNHSTDSRQCFSSCSLPGASHFVPEKNITGRLLIDLGYFHFGSFAFVHPKLGIETFPRFLDSPRTYEY